MWLLDLCFLDVWFIEDISKIYISEKWPKFWFRRTHKGGCIVECLEGSCINKEQDNKYTFPLIPH